MAKQPSAFEEVNMDVTAAQLNQPVSSHASSPAPELPTGSQASRVISTELP